MGRTSIYPLVDRVLGGTLEDRLRTQRAAGASFDDIARALQNEDDITVSTETVRKWCHELAIEEELAS